ncbi:trimeric intracellular cation channel type B [Latimeria chalumnae]|uniref:Transmembrane protein 38B n=1 Tax=Latimeria chalumnae TaxID=7897 RepID=M3XKN7_LATCH|nr:PREDICTED: trimeric intracellular cation channel type B [Latimeria chalumnae]|eukprot:XP_006009200.1 PREDICTED: trimeric intracellular cation channel type B [Latimeria chalumnae]
MELLSALKLDQLSLHFSKISLYPYFDMAHYIVSVMALREQLGVQEVARRSPIACWFSAMIYCFGGAFLSAILLGVPPIEVLSKNHTILLASTVWYMVFYCPQDMAYSFCAFLPIRLVVTGMKEVTRTWKVLTGVNDASRRYTDAPLVMIVIGWTRGAGGSLMSNFEQLIRGIWRPESNELLNMSQTTRVTLFGAILFTCQKIQLLPIAKHHLMLMYAVFCVITKVTMMLTGSEVSPLAPLESMLGWLFSNQIKTDLQANSNATNMAFCNANKAPSQNRPAVATSGTEDEKTNGNTRKSHKLE